MLSLEAQLPQASVLQDVPRMTTIKDSISSKTDTYLVLSFETAGHTTVLDVRGTSIRAASLPGLDLDSFTLLLHRMPDQSLLQVTAKVRAHMSCFELVIRSYNESPLQKYFTVCRSISQKRDTSMVSRESGRDSCLKHFKALCHDHHHFRS